MTGQNYKPLNIYDGLPLFLANDIEMQICIILIEKVDKMSINMICLTIINLIFDLEKTNLSSWKIYHHLANRNH